MNITLIILIAAAVCAVIVTVLMLIGKRKPVNTVLFILIAIAAVTSICYNRLLKGDLKNSSSFGNHTGESVIYTETDDGYHYFKFKDLKKKDRLVAISDDTELPGYISNVDKGGIIIIWDGGQYLNENESTERDGMKCYTAKEPKKIEPNYKWLIMCVLFSLAAVTAVSNVISAIVESIRGNKKRQS